VIVLNSTALEQSATLSVDERTIYFVSSRGNPSGDADLWMSSRATPDTAFEPPTKLAGVNTDQRDEQSPSVTQDGLFLYGSQDLGFGKGPGYKIVLASRGDVTSAFGLFDPAPQQPINTLASSVTPFVLPDRTALYFSASRNGSSDILRSSWQGAAFDGGEVIAAVSTSDPEDYPVVAADDLTMYFASARPGGAGDKDIYVSRRNTRVEEFGPPQQMVELATSSGEVPNWISADGCVLYFTQQATGGSDIFVATRGL
jgi:hypothetical protein